MSDEDPNLERWRAAFFATGRPAPGPDCSDPARIWAAARGQATPAEAEALLDHALACASCATAWRLAREVASESSSDAGRAARPDPQPAWRRPYALAVAAAVLAVALLPIAVRLWRAPSPPVYREEDRAAIRSLLPEGGALRREDCLLRWTPGPEGSRYSVRVLRPDLSVVTEASGLEASEFLVPAQAIENLPAGEPLYWRVEAHLPDGTQAVSETFSARLE